MVGMIEFKSDGTCSTTNGEAYSRLLSDSQTNTTNLETELTELKSTIGEFSTKIDDITISLDNLVAHEVMDTAMPVDYQLDI